MATILDQHGKPIESREPARRDLVALTFRRNRDIRPDFDAAGSSNEMQNYWATADAYDDDSAHSKSIRAKLVQRSRYEVGDNGFADGMTQTYANYLVGVGPALSRRTPDTGFNAMVELECCAWTKAVHFRRKLWCLSMRCLEAPGSRVIRVTSVISRGFPGRARVIRQRTLRHRPPNASHSQRRVALLCISLHGLSAA